MPFFSEIPDKFVSPRSQFKYSLILWVISQKEAQHMINRYAINPSYINELEKAKEKKSWHFPQILYMNVIILLYSIFTANVSTLSQSTWLL